MRLLIVILAIFPLASFAQDVPVDVGATLMRVDELMTKECPQWPVSAGGAVAPAAPLAVPKPSTDASAVLKDVAQSDDAQTRMVALEGMAQSDAPGHVDDFVGALADADPAVRQFAAHVLNGLPPELFLEKVLGLMQSEDTNTSACVASSLPLLRDSLEQPLIAILLRQDEEPFRRQLAASSLAYMKSTASISALANVAESAEPQLARVCASALGAIPDVVVVPQLVRLTYHPAPAVRYAALTGLAAVAAPEATVALGQISAEAREDDPALTVQAVAYLAERPGQQVIPLLIDVMRRNKDAVAGAVTALRRLTGEDYGDSPDLWEKWWQEKLSQPPPTTEELPFGIQMMN
jgi:HEAT repeat protein